VAEVAAGGGAFGGQDPGAGGVDLVEAADVGHGEPGGAGVVERPVEVVDGGGHVQQ
jgi:hypothetical protein